MANILTVTNGNDSGPGSLRDNINTANTNILITTINFDMSVNLVTLTSGSLMITRGYNITGAGVIPTINGSGNTDTTIIANTPGTTLDIDNIILTGSQFGAINIIDITLNLTNVTIDNNISSVGISAGIHAQECKCNINNCVISNNSSPFGGGMIAINSDVAIDTTTFDNNRAEITGGGIQFSATVFSISNSTISNNAVTDNISFGGGVYIQNSLSELNTIFNSTISNNSISTSFVIASGGGLYINQSYLTINNSTIAYNLGRIGGGIQLDQSTLILNNTIVAKNSSNSNPDISGNVSGSFYSLVGNGTGNNVVNGVNGNIVNIDPNIGNLANNGGPTKTIALLLGSPAIDSGSIPLTPPGTVYDQRQSPFLRVSGTNIDIGAFELQQEPICYKDSSKILIKNKFTNKIEYLSVKNVFTNNHTVYDITHNKFINIKLNAVTGNVSEFYLFKKDCFGFNKPNEDFYVTGGHKILINGKLIKARDISNGVRVILPSQPVYSICTDYQCCILVNGLNVLTWAHKDFLRYCKYRVTDFHDNC